MGTFNTEVGASITSSSSLMPLVMNTPLRHSYHLLQPTRLDRVDEHDAQHWARLVGTVTGEIRQECSKNDQVPGELRKYRLLASYDHEDFHGADPTAALHATTGLRHVLVLSQDEEILSTDREVGNEEATQPDEGAQRPVKGKLP